MKKKLIALLTAIMFVTTLIPSMAFATETECSDESCNHVSSIGTTHYNSITEAIASAEDGAKIVLLKDVAEDVVVEKNIILDLNGKTLTNVNGDTITNKGTLKIVDESAEKSGKVDSVKHAKSAVYNVGTLELNGGTYTRSLEDSTSNSFYTIRNDEGLLTINKGVVVENSGHFSSMIRNAGAGKVATMVINGGTFTGGLNTVKNDDKGVLTITDGDFSNTSQFVIMNWHKAEIEGGKFETKSDSTKAVLFTSMYGNDATVTAGELIVTGGSFIAHEGQKVIDDSYDENNSGSAVVSGGTFNKAIEEKFLKEGYELVATDGGFGALEIKGSVIGSITNYGAGSEVTIKLFEADKTEATYETTTTMQSYSIAKVKAGTYTMQVSSEGCVTREYTITVESSEQTQNVVITVLGDVNLDGEVKSTDALMVQRYSIGSQELDSYQLKLADANSDGEIRTTDALWIQRQTISM